MQSTTATSMHATRSVTPDRAPVIDLTGFVELLDWMVAADRFTRFGDARDLADLLKTQHGRSKPDPHTASKAAMATWNGSPVKTTARQSEPRCACAACSTTK